MQLIHLPGQKVEIGQYRKTFPVSSSQKSFLLIIVLNISAKIKKNYIQVLNAIVIIQSMIIRPQNFQKQFLHQICQEKTSNPHFSTTTLDKLLQWLINRPGKICIISSLTLVHMLFGQELCLRLFVWLPEQQGTTAKQIEKHH